MDLTKIENKKGKEPLIYKTRPDCTIGFIIKIFTSLRTAYGYQISCAYTIILCVCMSMCAFK